MNWKFRTFLFSSAAEYSGKRVWEFEVVESFLKLLIFEPLPFLWWHEFIGRSSSSRSPKSSPWKLSSSGDESMSLFFWKSWSSGFFLWSTSRWRNLGDDDEWGIIRDCWGFVFTRETFWDDAQISAWYCDTSGSESLRKS